MALAGVAVVAICLSLLVAPGAAAPAFAATSLEINSVVWGGGPDVSPGDGVCADEAGRCTLRAALGEANAAGGNAVVSVAPTFAGGAIAVTDCNTTNFMAASGVPITGTAYFAITAPNIVLDLENKISIDSADCASTALYVNGTGASVQNSTGFFSGDVSFLVGSGGSGAQFSNLTQVSTANYFPESSVVLTNGANNVTVRNSTFAGFSDPDARSAVVYVAANASISNLRLVGNTFSNDQSTPECSATNGRGCRNNGIAFGDDAVVSTFVVQGNTFSSFDGNSRTPINLGIGAATLSGFALAGNTFTNMSNAPEAATLSLPSNSVMSGTNSISGNTFKANPGSALAIYWDGAVTNGAVRSNVTISDNYFNGYGTSIAPTVLLRDTGSLPVERNVFGPNTVASVVGGGETAANALLNNANAASNSAIRTRVPGLATLQGSCTVSVSLLAGTTPAPVDPHHVDVYWSAINAQGAEILLGSSGDISAATRNVVVPYTSGTAGRLRVQTQGAPRTAGSQTQSSQYSRTIAVARSPSCAPKLEINQAAGQPDTTSTRVVRFTVRASAQLVATGVDSLQASDISTAGSTAAGVAVTGVTQIGKGLYEVTATANDSGTIVLSVPAGVVKDAGNSVTNLASTSTDNSISYQNPLSRNPASLTVYQNAPGESYVVSRDAALPPTAPITLGVSIAPAWATTPATAAIRSGVVSQPIVVTSAADLGGTSRTAALSHTVTSTDANYNGLILPQVAITANIAATITPTSGPVTGGQLVTVSLNYQPAAVTGISFDGIAATFTGSGGSRTATTPARASPTGVNVAVDVRITYANGAVVLLPGAYTYVPQGAMTVTKRGFNDAAHTQAIVSGADVLTGQTVYWTYTVQNTGETPLNNLTVKDAKLPAGTYPGGVVCTVAALAIGASSVCAASAAVTP